MNISWYGSKSSALHVVFTTDVDSSAESFRLQLCDVSTLTSCCVDERDGRSTGYRHDTHPPPSSSSSSSAAAAAAAAAAAVVVVVVVVAIKHL